MKCRMTIVLLASVLMASAVWPSIVSAVDAPAPVAKAPDPAATVNKLVDQLSAKDPVDREKASESIEGLPPLALPLVQAAAQRGDRTPDADRDTMEKWFKRAMEANPDCTEACESKLGYLQPKWHGDATAMLEFGHQCLDEGNWDGKVPWILIDAHTLLSKAEPDPNSYYRQSGVWDDIHAVYSSYLQVNPAVTSIKNIYCHYACLCGQWKVANKLFAELGDKTDPAKFGGEAAMNDLKKRAADLGADTAPAQP